MASYSEKDKEKILTKIFNRISNKEPVRKILKEKDYPAYDTFCKWIEEEGKEERIERYLGACEARAALIFNECLEIADKQDKDVKTDKDGKKYTDHNVINRSRLMIETRKWMLGKMNPTKYGDRIQNDVVIDDKRKSIDDIFPSTEEITGE